jgi:hypothetical protein
MFSGSLIVAPNYRCTPRHCFRIRAIAPALVEGSWNLVLRYERGNGSADLIRHRNRFDNRASRRG